MRADIAKYVRVYTTCAQTKPFKNAPAGFMGGHTEVSRPWEDICVDLMGPLPRSLAGNSYILVVTDLFTKFAFTFAIRQGVYDVWCTSQNYLR